MKKLVLALALLLPAAAQPQAPLSTAAFCCLIPWIRLIPCWMQVE